MRCGTISLYNAKDVCLSVKRYDSKTRRNQIIDNWRELYRDFFNEMSIQISPVTRASEFDITLLIKMKKLKKQGFTNIRIGEICNVSDKTVHNYLKIEGVMSEEIACAPVQWITIVKAVA